MEVFKDIKGYEGIYQVSDLGNVKSLPNKKRFSEKILKPQKSTHDYLHLSLRKDGKQKTRTIHQLVAEAFLDHTPCGLKLIVNHKNFNRHDNRLENLEIDTNTNNTNKKHLNSSSEYIGVSWYEPSNKWVSRIQINGKAKHLGYFTCEKEASEAYQFKLKNI